MTTIYKRCLRIRKMEPAWKKVAGLKLSPGPEPTNYRVHSYPSCVHGASVGESMWAEISADIPNLPITEKTQTVPGSVLSPNLDSVPPDFGNASPKILFEVE